LPFPEYTLAALHETEERYKSLVEASPDAIILFDLEGNILLCNHRLAVFLGFEDSKELLHHSIYEFIPEPEHKRIKKCFFDVNENGSVSDIECDFYSSKGKNFSAEMSLVLIENPSANTCAGIIRDISSRKKAETEKAHLDEQFRAIYKMEAVGQLAGGIAHDFNNILGAISGYADLIKLKYSGDKKLEKYAQTIFMAASRASDLTNKLLTFARRKNSELTRFDAHDILNEIAQFLNQTTDNNTVIKCEFNASESIVTADPNQLKSAVMNLAFNARDAMANGGELVIQTANKHLDTEFPKSNIFSVCPGYYLTISVIDFGIGMDKQTLSHLFEPFFTTKKTGKGAGLGLASVYGTVKNLRGYVDVESSPGNGSRFTLYIPVIQMKNSGNAEPDNEHKSHILIADDESYMRDAMSEILVCLGYSATVCSNGEEAYEKYKSNPASFDLVILDMKMPGISGRECSRKIHEINRDAKVIIITGYNVENERQQILDEGIIEIIHKPVASSLLAKVISETLNK
jgi:two-component system cell cycle sensor histidine kinase/response regulator CckA